MGNDRNIQKNVNSIPIQFPYRHGRISAIAKRMVDILVSLLGLLVLWPVFAFIGILIKRDSPGPIFYWGPRAGKGGKVFSILKFRTMREEPASYQGSDITGQNDPRVTLLGQWLRDTKVNELPQLWNVFLGEMSLVGPRPEIPEIAETWPENVRREILSMSPGITSPTSILYRDEEKRLKTSPVINDYMENILPDKLRLDQLYVRHHNFITDLDALFWTFVILIPRLGDKKIPEGWLFVGPVSRLMRRYVNWLIIDFFVAFLCIGMVGVLWRLSGPLDVGLEKAISMAVILAFLFSIFNYLLGLQSVSWSHAAAEDVLRLFISCGLVTIVGIGLQVSNPPVNLLPVRFTYTAGITVLFGFVAVRYRLRLVTGFASRWINLRNSGYGAPERVLVVGAGEGSEFAAWLLSREEFKRIYSIVGIVDDNPARQGMRYDGLKVLGFMADIPDLVKRLDVGVIFYTLTGISSESDKRIISICKETRLHVIMLSDVLNVLHQQLAKGGLGAGIVDSDVSEPFKTVNYADVLEHTRTPDV